MTVKVAVLLVPDSVAVMVDDVLLDTFLLVTVKVAVVLPGATVTLLGTVAADVLLLDSEIDRPLDGAALLIVTVPVELAEPPFTLVGLSDRPVSVGASTVSVAVTDLPL